MMDPKIAIIEKVVAFFCACVDGKLPTFFIASNVIFDPVHMCIRLVEPQELLYIGTHL